jgi:hypothetical protein
MAKKRIQIIKVKDYGDPWVNRLAVVAVIFAKMEPCERVATLEFMTSKYLAHEREGE